MSLDPLPNHYDAFCRSFAKTSADFDVWLTLGRELPNRPGWWWFDPTAEGQFGDPAWCFGLVGACRLAISPVDGQFLLYIHEQDTELTFDHFAEVESWLEEHEKEHAGFTSLQEELLDGVAHREMDAWSDEQPE